MKKPGFHTHNIKVTISLGTSIFCFFLSLSLSLLFFFPAILFFPTYYAQILLLHKNFAHQNFNLFAKSTIVIIKSMPAYTILRYTQIIYHISGILSMIEASL